MALKEYQDCSSVALKKNSFWDNLKAIFFAHSYPYSVVYTDGYVSQNRKDGMNRTPFGIIVKGVILRLDAPDEKISLLEVSDLIDNQFFAGYRAYLPPLHVLKYIRSHIKEINKLITLLGGDPFVGDWYASCNEYTDFSLGSQYLIKVVNFSRSNMRMWAVHMSAPWFVGCSYTLPSDKSRIRLVYCV